VLIWSAAEGIVRVGERGGRCSGFVGGEDGWSGQRRHLRRGGHDGSSAGKTGGVGIVGACNREAAAPVASRRRQLLRRTCAAAAAICEGWSGLWLWGSATDGNAPGESIRIRGPRGRTQCIAEFTDLPSMQRQVYLTCWTEMSFQLENLCMWRVHRSGLPKSWRLTAC